MLSINDSFPYKIACNTLLGWGPLPLSIPVLKACPTFLTLQMGRDNGFMCGSKEILQSKKTSPSCSQMWLCPRWSGRHFPVLAVPQVINNFHLPLLRIWVGVFPFLVGKSSPVRVAQLNKKKASLQILRDLGCAKGLHLASALRATRVLQRQGCA